MDRERDGLSEVRQLGCARRPQPGGSHGLRPLWRTAGDRQGPSGRQRHAPSRARAWQRPGPRRRWGLWLLLGSLLTVSALLASVPERPSRPPQRRGADLTRGPVLLRPGDHGRFGVIGIC